MRTNQDQPLVSVVVKCLNEAANLGRCLRSLTAEVLGRGYNAEIILAGSISTGGSVEAARGFGVTVVQLADVADRRCGAAGHLGWQCARGQFLLLTDGDQELLPAFLGAALAAMRGDGRLAAVRGGLTEMSDGIVYQGRQARPDPSRRPGLVDHVTGCAVYRTAAVQEAGHFMDRNLHCFEEFELGPRLRVLGWQLRMLDVPCIRHYGHRDALARLLLRRWRTRFLMGYGEMLRGAWGQPCFWQALLAILWWGVSLGLAAAAAFGSGSVPGALLALAGATALPFMALLARKQSLERAAYA